ncbi:hypothetical protein SAMN05444161_9107 [Rhizobiales bacterium GAS191]|nr:hypothetical protein SAMN05444161_9107 [Rhizobiales bacterium GAS191]
MTRGELISHLRRALSLVPALIRHDPLFRYAAIGAVLFLLLVIGRLAQDMAGPGPIPLAPDADVVTAPADRPPSAATPTSRTTNPAAVPSIAPGRSLDAVSVGAAPADGFGTLPPRNRQP